MPQCYRINLFVVYKILVDRSYTRLSINFFYYVHFLRYDHAKMDANMLTMNGINVSTKNGFCMQNRYIYQSSVISFRTATFFKLSRDLKISQSCQRDCAFIVRPILNFFRISSEHSISCMLFCRIPIIYLLLKFFQLFIDRKFIFYLLAQEFWNGYYYTTEKYNYIVSFNIIYKRSIALIEMNSRQLSVNKISNASSVKKFRTSLQQQSHIQKILPSFQAYLKQYPLDIQDDILQIVKMIEPLQSEFSQNLKTLKLYKQQLGYMFEENWCDFLSYLKTIVVKMSKRTKKILTERQGKINQLLDTIKNMELEKIELQSRIEKIANLRQLQNAQLVMANNQLDIVNRQMRSIYKILQSDMSQVMSYLTQLQQKKQKIDQSVTNQMNASLNSLSVLLDSVQKQQVQNGQTLSTMKQMIKAMTKSTKVNTGTQVDQSQLQTNVGKIFSKNQQQNILLEIADGISVNIANFNKTQSLVDKMKLKQKQISHQTYIPKKSIDKPWALTPALLIFLENMSKQNQIGRVLPWDYVKSIITDIYQQRIKYQTQISTSIIGNSMSFDEFVIFYFISKFKIRRLAQVKLLEMIISLKYYAKFWSKADIFCCLMDVMKYQPLTDLNQSTVYKFDHYSQHYFFSIYKHIKKFNIFHDDDGTVYAQVQNIRKFIKVALFFTDQMSRSRILSKLQKNIRIYNKLQYIDLDLSILLILDEYFTVKKRNINVLTKSFSKSYQKNKGYFSLSQLYEVFDSLGSIYKKSDQNSPQQYPIQSQMYLSKLYLFSITSGKNNYQILVSNFLLAVQKYGFDCPFPFIKVNKKKGDKNEQISRQLLSKQIESKSLSSHKIVVNDSSGQNQIQQTGNSEQHGQNSKKNVQNLNLNAVRIDVGSKLFSQHYSILKQLNDYVKIFGQTLAQQRNPQILWKNFNQINTILQRGCQFLKYPLVKQRVK